MFQNARNNYAMCAFNGVRHDVDLLEFVKKKHV